MLWRALGSVKHGLYVDVGAQDPIRESVSRLFHEAGWRGVHVEPHPEYAASLRAARPNDLVIQAAVAPSAGLTTFYAFEGTGLSTVVESVATRHIEDGYPGVRLTVPSVTLDMILAECAGEDIHWLKLDVEGFERSALEGWQCEIRPWIVVVEAVEVGGRAPTHEDFESLVIGKGYHFAYFDGLNRFYISDEHPELDQHFAVGPCLWDDILAAPEGQMARVLQKIFGEQQAEIAQALRAHEVDLATLRAKLASVEAESSRIKAAADVALLERRHSRLRLAYARRGDALALLGQQVSALSEAKQKLVADLDRVGRERNDARKVAFERQEALTESAREFHRLEQRLLESRSEAERLKRVSEDATGRMEFLLGSLEAIASAPPREVRAQTRQALTMVPVARQPDVCDQQAPMRSVAALTGAGDQLFVDACYRTLLGRPADPAGSTFYLNQLREGKSRDAVLREIATSAEARSHGALLPGLAAFLKSGRGREVRLRRLTAGAFRGVFRMARKGDALIAERLAKLLSSPEPEFIQELYGAVLSRGPRPDEVTRAAAGLAVGDDRLTLLARLRWSQEGRRTKVSSPLARRTGWYASRNWPLLGAILERRAFARWAVGLNVRRRGIETKLAIVESGIEAQQRKHMPRRHVVWAGSKPPPGGQSIWYCGADWEATALLDAAIPATIEAIACADPGTARRIIDVGVGCAVRSVGALPEGKSGPAADALLELMAALDASRPARLAFARRPLKIAMLTTWNAKCGIATHSNELVETFQDADVEILAPTSDEALVADGANVRRLWRKEKTQSDLGKVIDYLATKTPDMLVVQFNFAFFEHGDLDALLKSAAGMGIVTVVIMHTTTDPQDAPGFHVHEIAGGLAAASRVIVHNLEDVANLAALGIVDNVLRLPHGVRRGQALVSRPAPGACPVIATFGFCFPNKGLLEIVKAVRYLKDGGTPVRLRMFNALHPDSSSRSTLRAVRAEISALKLEDDIELHSDFLDLDLVDREIAKADLFVNPYQTTNESASGAVRIGLRNKVPTLVTPLAIFDELGEVVSRAPGRRPQDLAVGIRRALEDARDPAAAEEVQARIEDWLVEHDFKQQSMRLGKIGRSFKIKMMLEGMH